MSYILLSPFLPGISQGTPPEGAREGPLPSAKGCFLGGCPPGRNQDPPGDKSRSRIPMSRRARICFSLAVLESGGARMESSATPDLPMGFRRQRQRCSNRQGQTIFSNRAPLVWRGIRAWSSRDNCDCRRASCEMLRWGGRIDPARYHG